MKKIMILITIFAVLLTITSCSGNRDYSTEIHGYIYDFTNEEPIENAKVTIGDSLTYTDNTGEYFFSNVVDDQKYKIQVSKDNYMDISDTVYVKFSARHDYYLIKREDSSARISGTINDPFESTNNNNYRENIPNDNNLDFQWHIHNINLPLAWDIETGKETVKVAVLDTGYITHPDLEDNINMTLAKDFVGNNINSDNDTDSLPYDESAYYNSDTDFQISHGTHIAGIIGAKGDNTLGIAGINWDVEIVPIRTFNTIDSDSNLQKKQLADAIKHATNVADVNVIHISKTFTNKYDPDEFPTIEAALEEAYNKGITIVAPAGDDGKDNVYYPASSQYTISVGASTLDNKISSYSNKGVDIYAPGGETSRSFSDSDIVDKNGIYIIDKNNDGKSDGIISTNNFSNKKKDNYTWMSGTPVAAAQVSGVAALLYSYGVEDPATIKNILTQTSSKGFNLSEEGILNAYSALRYNSNNNTPRTKVVAVAEIGDDLHVMSNITTVDDQGDYELKHIKSDYDIQILAWKDINNNFLIDSEDYIGKYQELNNPVILNLSKNEHKEDINFSIEPMSQNNQAGYLNNIRYNLIHSPPPDLIRKENN